MTPQQSWISKAGGGQYRQDNWVVLWAVSGPEPGVQGWSHVPRWFFSAVGMMCHCGTTCGHHASGTLESTLDLKHMSEGEVRCQIYCVSLPSASAKKALPREPP